MRRNREGIETNKPNEVGAVAMDLLAAIDLDAPSAFGIPLGTLLVLWFIWTLLKQQGGGSSGSSTSENTMNVKLRNELGSDVIQFQSATAKLGGGKCVIKYTVKIKKAGTYLIAGGKAEFGSFNIVYYGTRSVRGEAGDVISGAVSCAQFHSGVWGIGAFRSTSDVPTS